MTNEKPVVIDLSNQPTRGVGQEKCEPGSQAMNGCRDGMMAQANCINGTEALLPP